ncbi:DHHC zinc finger domain containing protein [Tritrichomonas foetus]|uniref:Palmitoyltransferase n=1 Tax=Tritrichomonas foetus TaxID=1144522 RepID=A0A1J4L3D4_9EUKA|nr:DHHC zinc finger domain containing protein [Tritrichomonas foetus]|eukprot:OHT16462.1 DHHC zinc finger domain containing protein [Tritrichomonas foetus]
MGKSKRCKNAHAYEGRTVMVEGEMQKVPQFSEWRYVCRCCGGKCNLVYFPVIKRYFCNQWECNITYPLFVVFFLTIAFVFSILAIIEFLESAEQIVMLVLTSFFYLIWLISYFCAVCSSPGYLPFYWAVEKKEIFTYEQQMDGVITNKDQYDFAAYNGRPERGSFSVQARRLVLKADHICKWIANWVGLKNYRYFYQKVVWALLYFIDWFIVLILVCIKFKNNWAIKPGNIGMLICALPMLGFFVFIFIIFRRHTRYTCHNTTTLQQFKLKKNSDKHNYYDLGCWRNWVQVFGPAKYCLIWLLPIPIKRKWGGFKWEKNRDLPKSDDDDEGNEGDQQDDKESSSDDESSSSNRRETKTAIDVNESDTSSGLIESAYDV